MFQELFSVPANRRLSRIVFLRVSACNSLFVPPLNPKRPALLRTAALHICVLICRKQQILDGYTSVAIAMPANISLQHERNNAKNKDENRHQRQHQ